MRQAIGRVASGLAALPGLLVSFPHQELALGFCRCRVLSPCLLVLCSGRSGNSSCRELPSRDVFRIQITRRTRRHAARSVRSAALGGGTAAVRRRRRTSRGRGGCRTGRSRQGCSAAAGRRIRLCSRVAPTTMALQIPTAPRRGRLTRLPRRAAGAVGGLADELRIVRANAELAAVLQPQGVHALAPCDLLDYRRLPPIVVFNVHLDRIAELEAQRRRHLTDLGFVLVLKLLMQFFSVGAVGRFLLLPRVVGGQLPGNRGALRIDRRLLVPHGIPTAGLGSGQGGRGRDGIGRGGERPAGAGRAGRWERPFLLIDLRPVGEDVVRVGLGVGDVEDPGRSLEPLDLQLAGVGLLERESGECGGVGCHVLEEEVEGHEQLRADGAELLRISRLGGPKREAVRGCRARSGGVSAEAAALQERGGDAGGGRLVGLGRDRGLQVPDLGHELANSGADGMLAQGAPVFASQELFLFLLREQSARRHDLHLQIQPQMVPGVGFLRGAEAEEVVPVHTRPGVLVEDREDQAHELGTHLLIVQLRGQVDMRGEHRDVGVRVVPAEHTRLAADGVRKVLCVLRCLDELLRRDLAAVGPLVVAPQRQRRVNVDCVGHPLRHAAQE
mmetsp:Transcript_72606/g.208438  ORF Transcript_72606/g.208438 Transcript_72606/m.208438 type:complete len:614 (+) Transcript_72606:219-2060(+)